MIEMNGRFETAHLFLSSPRYMYLFAIVRWGRRAVSSIALRWAPVARALLQQYSVQGWLSKRD